MLKMTTEPEMVCSYRVLEALACFRQEFAFGVIYNEHQLQDARLSCLGLAMAQRASSNSNKADCLSWRLVMMLCLC